MAAREVPQRSSCCQLEVDAVIEDIINRQEVSGLCRNGHRACLVFSFCSVCNAVAAAASWR